MLNIAESCYVHAGRIICWNILYTMGEMLRGCREVPQIKICLHHEESCTPSIDHCWPIYLDSPNTHDTHILNASLQRHLLFFPLSLYLRFFPQTLNTNFLVEHPDFRISLWSPFIFPFLFCLWSPEGTKYERAFLKTVHCSLNQDQ